MSFTLKALQETIIPKTCINYFQKVVNKHKYQRVIKRLKLNGVHQFEAVHEGLIICKQFTLRERRFCRICCVGKGLKYTNTSAHLPPCIFGKLDACRI